MVLRRPLPGPADHARRDHGRGARAGRRNRGALARGEPGQARAVRRDRRCQVQADRRAGRRADPHLRDRGRARAGRPREGDRAGRGRARGARDADLRDRRPMIAAASGTPVSITGLGCYVPERVVTNDELAKVVDTSDEWIRTRTGIRERRYASDREALSDIALPAAELALERAGVKGADIDLLIVGTVTSDMLFPSTAAILADRIGAVDAAAYDLSAGCTGFMYGITQAAGMLASGLNRRALVIGADVLSKLMNFADRSTCVLFGDGAGAVVIEVVPEQGFLGFELGADGAGGRSLWLPGSGSRIFDEPERFVKMNGREVFKFATRILVQSAQAVMAQCGVTIDDVDVYVPHQANMRIIDHATKKLGVPSEKVVINVDRFGNTSSGSIPLALADAAQDGRLKPGKLVLMTGMGAGLTWGSALMRWTKEMS